MFQVNPWLVATVTIVVVVIFAFVISRIVRAHRHQASTGWEELIGKTALVKTALDPEGMVFFKGERWTAVSEEGAVAAGETVVITKIDSLKLYVKKQ